METNKNMEYRNNPVTKNLITGIGGLVASHLADLLIEKGEEVYGTCRWTEDLSKVNHLKEKITFVPMDLNDLSSCINAIETYRPNYIFHLAAQSYVSDSYLYPAETIRTNTIGTMNLLEAVRFVKKQEESYDPVIHVCSTSEVYGLVGKDKIPIKESTGFNPSNPYAVGKVGADMIALMYWTNYGIKTIRTRMFTHTSGRRTMMSAECAFARQIARIEQGLQEPVVYHGNLDSVRTWADARDAVIAYYTLVRECKPGEVYNIGGDNIKTIGEMLDYLISLSPMSDKIKKEMDSKLLRPYDVDLQIPDVSKFVNETGWKPYYSFEETLRGVLDGWRTRVKNENRED